MVPEGDETLCQSFVMLNSITLKPHCPEEVICAFKLRHNVIVKLRHHETALKQQERQSERVTFSHSPSHSLDTAFSLYSSLFCHTQDHFPLIH